MSEYNYRPVVRAFRYVVAMQMIVGPGVSGLTLFEIVDWNADQVAWINGFAAIVVAAIAYAMGLNAETNVTPVAEPRDASLVPLIPADIDPIV